ncbi:MAG: hypothetical protein JW742_09400 [Candidatus Aminicenantes bacterium]|nr:hypothetical protein [Candidatus Aminicenantes bacterium]
MNKTVKILVAFLIFDAFAVGGYFLYKGRSSPSREPAAWKIIDQAYVPEDDVEAYLKDDAVAKELLPVEIKNYGRDRKVLGRFKGVNYARPREGVLKAMTPGLEDWKLIDLRYTNKNGRRVERTILYAEVKGAWMVVDSGRLLE